MDYFPVFLDAKKLNILVVGGGSIAARKIELFLKTTASIQIVAPTINARVSQLINNHSLTWYQQKYNSNLLDTVNLVIAATDIKSVNQQVHNDCSVLNMLVNVVDSPELCSYITPAIIDRDPMLVAISSSGSSPVLVRLLRESIEKLMPAHLGTLAKFTSQHRLFVQQSLAHVDQRRDFWQSAIKGEIGKLIEQNDISLATEKLKSQLLNHQSQPSGTFVILETGDGDPDNLTLKAHRYLQQVDSLYFSADINLSLIEYVRRDAEKHQFTSQSQAILSAQNKNNNRENKLVITTGLTKDILFSNYPELSDTDVIWIQSGS